MASKDPRRNLRAWRNKRAALTAKAKASGKPIKCFFCPYEIDLSLHYTDRGALTWHHVDPIGTGGHILGEVVPAHRSCNSGYGDGTRTDPLQGRTRDW